MFCYNMGTEFGSQVFLGVSVLLGVLGLEGIHDAEEWLNHPENQKPHFLWGFWHTGWWAIVDSNH